jgi:hypothetical protein
MRSASRCWPPTPRTSPRWCSPSRGQCRFIIRRHPSRSQRPCRHRRSLPFRNPLRCQWCPRTSHQRSRPSVCLPTVRRELPAKKLSAVFAPFGRLIPCETVITVDSASIQTPIVGLVTENIYYGGKLVIPAGTEIHGTAQTDHQRERIASGNNWTFIWQNGMEMQIKAIALDREFDDETNQSGWAITDGSAGLRGEVIKSDNFADIKLVCRHVPVRRGGRADGKTTDRLRPRQQSHAQQRALCGRAGGAANLRPANFGFDSKGRFLRPRAERKTILPLRPANH